MTDEQINAAIAEARGWTDIVNNPDFGLMGIDPSTHGLRTCVPYYANDLNAMHEAEETLNTDELFEQYYLTLYETTRSTRWPVRAKARQRAEAFLRTLGKWKEVEK